MALDLILNNAGAITPYGVVYDNGMKLEPFYDGRHFPVYFYGAPQMAIEIHSGQDGAATGFLCLPCPERQIQRTLQRAGSGRQGFQMEVTTDDLPLQVSSAVSLARDGLDDLNALCRVIESLNTEQKEKLEAVVLMAQPQDAEGICQLAENLGQFDFVLLPDGQTREHEITELGYVAYHGTLALDELMREDPAEQYQREQGMGGLA